MTAYIPSKNYKPIEHRLGFMQDPTSTRFIGYCTGCGMTSLPGWIEQVQAWWQKHLVLIGQLIAVDPPKLKELVETVDVVIDTEPLVNPDDMKGKSVSYKAKKKGKKR